MACSRGRSSSPVPHQVGVQAWQRVRTPSPEMTYISRHASVNSLPTVLVTPVFFPQFPVPRDIVWQQTTLAEPVKRHLHWADMVDKDDDTVSDADTADTVGCQDGSSGSSHGDLDLPEDVPSLGSLNHPHSCGQPCKYIKKARGCRDGINCAYCHICVWQSRRHGKSKKTNPKVIPEIGALTLGAPF